MMQIASQKYVLHLLKKLVKLMSDAFQHYVYLFFWCFLFLFKNPIFVLTIIML